MIFSDFIPLQLVGSINMKVKKVLWLFFVASFCSGSEIPEYIGRLIEDLKVKEPSQVHDVVLIDLGSQNKELTDRNCRDKSKDPGSISLDYCIGCRG